MFIIKLLGIQLGFFGSNPNRITHFSNIEKPRQSFRFYMKKSGNTNMGWDIAKHD